MDTPLISANPVTSPLHYSTKNKQINGTYRLSGLRTPTEPHAVSGIECTIKESKLLSSRASERVKTEFESCDRTTSLQIIGGEHACTGSSKEKGMRSLPRAPRAPNPVFSSPHVEGSGLEDSEGVTTLNGYHTTRSVRARLPDRPIWKGFWLYPNQ